MSEPQLPREVRRRLAIIHHAEEVTGNVAMTCRYYGISRQVYYRWLRRYQEQGIDGLRDLSRRPHQSPNATHVDVVGKILYLRQNYHFGPARSRCTSSATTTSMSSHSGVWRILKRLDLNRLPGFPALQTARQTVETLRKAAPRPPSPDRRQIRCATEDRGPARRRPAHQVLPVHRDRRLHPTTRTAHLPTLRPENRDPVRRLRPRATALPGAGHPDRQRRRIPISLPLPRPRQRDRPPLHQTPHPAPQRESRAIPPHRRRRVLRGSSTASSSTTPRSSTTNSESGRTTTTTIAPTAASAARHPTNDYARKPRPRP